MLDRLLLFRVKCAEHFEEQEEDTGRKKHLVSTMCFLKITFLGYVPLASWGWFIKSWPLLFLLLSLEVSCHHG